MFGYIENALDQGPITQPLVRQHEVFAGDIQDVFKPIIPVATTSAVDYNEHLDHPQLQSSVVSNFASDSGQDSTGFIILPPVPMVDETVGGSDEEM